MLSRKEIRMGSGAHAWGDVWLGAAVDFAVEKFTNLCYNQITFDPAEPISMRGERVMSQVTKRALEQSLKNLLLQKPLTKITISDITTDCGINRMTFYYHFKDIYDLVEWVCLEDAKQALENRAGCDTWQQGYLQIFETVRDNKPFVMNVYRCVHQEQVEKYLDPQVDRLVLEIINSEMGDAVLREEDKEFIARVYSHVFIGVMLDWIKDDMREEPQRIVERIGILMKGSMAEAIARFQALSNFEL